jgi:AcrR family transcriptional regulator
MTVLGRPREFDRDSALQAAMFVFWRNGFSATSMNDLCDAMGIRSPSLYAAFGGKEALYLEAIEHNAKTVGMPSIWSRLTEAPTARAGIENLLLASADSLPADNLTPAGCMLTLAIGERCTGTIPDALRKIRSQLLNMLRSRLNDAQIAGELLPTVNLDGLSRFYLGVYQGISTQARDGATSAELQAIARTAMNAWPVIKVRKQRRALSRQDPGRRKAATHT